MVVEIDIHVGVVCGPVGEIDRREVVFTPNGPYQAYSLDITCPRKQLAVVVDGVRLLGPCI